jgi:hypothetical protein
VTLDLGEAIITIFEDETSMFDGGARIETNLRVEQIDLD